MVDQIPGLIIEEYRKNETNNKQVDRETSVNGVTPHATTYRSPIHSRRWLFLGVIACSILILGFWFMYIAGLIQDNKATLNPTSSFTNSEENKISNLLATFTKMENKLKGDLKSPSELKAMIAQALLPLFAASTTTSTTHTTNEISPTTTNP